MAKVYEYQGHVYSLRYGIQTIKTFERRFNTPLMGFIAQNNMLTLEMTEALFTMGLFDPNTAVATPTNRALQVFNGLIQEVGWVELMGDVVLQVQEDCPFLFQSREELQKSSQPSPISNISEPEKTALPPYTMNKSPETVTATAPPVTTPAGYNSNTDPR